MYGFYQVGKLWVWGMGHGAWGMGHWPNSAFQGMVKGKGVRGKG